MDDILRASGIYKNGYGTIPRLVMLDRRLSMGAKGVYAYLCSYAGAGEIAFPYRAKLTQELNISVHTYCGYMEQLKESGYIQKEQVRKGTKFSHNIYTINQFIPYTEYQRVLKENGIEAEGPQMPYVDIDELGYGKIPKSVTTDSRLSVKAKAIFAYIASSNHRLNSQTCAWGYVCGIMQTSKTTFYKSINELLHLGCIEEKYEQAKRGYAKPIYRVNPAYSLSEEGKEC